MCSVREGQSFLGAHPELHQSSTHAREEHDEPDLKSHFVGLPPPHPSLPFPSWSASLFFSLATKASMKICLLLQTFDGRSGTLRRRRDEKDCLEPPSCYVSFFGDNPIAPQCPMLRFALMLCFALGRIRWGLSSTHRQKRT